MLTKGFKDEHQRRITEALGKILQLEFIPDDSNAQVDSILEDLLGVSVTNIETINKEILLDILQKKDLSFENYVLLADVLFKILQIKKDIQQQNLAQTIIAIYEYAQDKNHIFSFGLIQKISQVKSYL
ncbi:hypothetical protein NBRC110019_21820 [Neptunitalea chrysea]|uniref:Uncharacterized protein n=1 Tax=Neptunitalea chrysea TaxID=1647581 RepID=A0A9W6B821_9FLAO|nr:hypothetical protein [Neptunitalea chrysea]GLB53142.1 hypothetical protein NBRC110019_21820 [Neptunitalea chrysea]